MKTIRNISTTATEKESISPLSHIGYSTFAAIAAHPFRVFMNRASLYQSPIATIKNSYPFLLKGVGINLIRGSLATGTQSYVKQWTQEQAGLSMGVIAAAFSGTLVASFVETPFIRKTMEKNQQHKTPIWRFNKSLFTMYFLREVGFSLAVLAKSDLSPREQQSVLLGATWATAVLHKFAVLEATRDKLSPDTTVPDFRKGVFNTIRSMAHGNIYTHPAFAVPFKYPKNYWSMIGNLLHVTCGANMFFFRLLYLITFREAYHLAVKIHSTPSEQSGFFKQKSNMPSTLVPTVSNQLKTTITHAK